VELLPQSLRDVFVLREINGLEYEEVAEIAGCTQEAARMRISRARRALRKALEKYLTKDE
jgi:RNA polymerase sigma-70 factor (ECF subfamily)